MKGEGNMKKKNEFFLSCARLAVPLQFRQFLKRNMTTGNIIRFVCILLLWLGLCWMLVTRAARIDFMVIFTIVASGIIVFVPLYKKYVRKKD